jgi:predicted NUDIX family NTP pyrophosphohydrolase
MAGVRAAAPARSAGLLMFRRREAGPEVLLVHPGGPFWRRRDAASWSIPKGLYGDDEAGLEAARREFEEETGLQPEGEFTELGAFRQPGGKIVAAWAVEGEFDPAALVSNTFALEWPPRSGLQKTFPEVDRAEWFALPQAREKILKGQLPILDALLRHLEPTGGSGSRR